jgi:hypothetical protein
VRRAVGALDRVREPVALNDAGPEEEHPPEQVEPFHHDLPHPRRPEEVERQRQPDLLAGAVCERVEDEEAPDPLGMTRRPPQPIGPPQSYGTIVASRRSSDSSSDSARSA